jgi:hypothetical protein
MLKYAFCAALIASVALVMQFWMVGLVFQQNIECHLNFDGFNMTINQLACAQALNGTQCVCLDFYNSSSVSRGIDFWTLTYAVTVCVMLMFLEIMRWAYVLIDCSELNSLVLFSPLGLLVMVLSPEVQYKINSRYRPADGYRVDAGLWPHLKWLHGYSTLLIIYDLLAVGLAAQFCGSAARNFSDPVILCVLISCGLDVLMRLVEVYAINLRNFHNQHPEYLQQVL